MYSLIYTQYTYSYYGIYLSFCVYYTKSVYSLGSSVYDEICVKILLVIKIEKLKMKSNFTRR